MDIPVVAGGVATAVFAFSTLPMLAKAWRTKNVDSYSPGNIALANIGNLIYLVYVVHLPLGPVLVLHLFHTLTTALMLFWYVRYVVLRRADDRSPGPGAHPSNHQAEQQHDDQAGDRQYGLHDRPRLDGLADAHPEVLLDQPEAGVVDV
jgi:uncharacterized protein with PQ loop repeat